MNSIEERYEIRTLTEDDFEDCWHVLGSNFTENEVISAHLKLPVNCSHYISYRSWKIKQYLRHHASIGAYEKGSNEIVACAILCISDKISAEKCPVSADSPGAPMNFRQLLCYLSFAREGEAEIMRAGNYMKVAYLACRPGHCKQGIATMLLKHAFDVAQKEACKKVLIRTSNYYVQRIAAKNEFDCRQELLFSEYVDPLSGSKVLQNVPKPHMKRAVLIKNL